MYGGREDDARYFQTFDDNSKESVKLVVHRKADGKVVYSYLRYNLLTSGGRKNAWFGMAVVFQGQYCRDVLSLYKLLDLAYQQLILKKEFGSKRSICSMFKHSSPYASLQMLPMILSK